MAVVVVMGVTVEVSKDVTSVAVTHAAREELLALRSPDPLGSFLRRRPPERWSSTQRISFIFVRLPLGSCVVAAAAAAGAERREGEVTVETVREHARRCLQIANISRVSLCLSCCRSLEGKERR